MHIFLTKVVGYFATLNMTYLIWGIAAVAPLPRNDTLFYVILNEVKNPTDELTVHIFLTKVVGYFATLNMT